MLLFVGQVSRSERVQQIHAGLWIHCERFYMFKEAKKQEKKVTDPPTVWKYANVSVVIGRRAGGGRECPSDRVGRNSRWSRCNSAVEVQLIEQSFPTSCYALDWDVQLCIFRSIPQQRRIQVIINVVICLK